MRWSPSHLTGCRAGQFDVASRVPIGPSFIYSEHSAADGNDPPEMDSNADVWRSWTVPAQTEEVELPPDLSGGWGREFRWLHARVGVHGRLFIRMSL